MVDTEPYTLDVREELRKGGEPLARILNAVNLLAPGQSLRLLVTFEPLPLYAVLARKGYGYRATQLNEGNWEVLFVPGDPSIPGNSGPGEEPHDNGAKWPPPSSFLDNRGLQPPEPLIRILDSLEHLGPGEVLEVLNERDPVFLYPELQSRGAAVRTDKQPDGVRLQIRRAP